ncbi:hypothetical protein ACFX11_012494 [Malus domestica]
MGVIITMEAIKEIISKAKAEEDFNTILVQDSQIVILAFLALQSHINLTAQIIPLTFLLVKYAIRMDMLLQTVFRDIPLQPQILLLNVKSAGNMGTQPFNAVT